MVKKKRAVRLRARDVLVVKILVLYDRRWGRGDTIEEARINAEIKKTEIAKALIYVCADPLVAVDSGGWIVTGRGYARPKLISPL